MNAVALLAAEQVLMLAPHPPLRSLVAEIAGPEATGSWWSHPRGKLIFNTAAALEDHPDTLVVKLVAGKVTFVHRDLWPALLRVVADPVARIVTLGLMGPAANELYGLVGERSSFVPRKEQKALATTLDRKLLILTRQEHSASGKHITVCMSWERWAAEVGAAPSQSSFGDALAAIKAATKGAKVAI